jgi:hypothetical protein
MDKVQKPSVNECCTPSSEPYKTMVIVPHPPYSPDLAPCDLILFSKLKMKLKGRHFETVSDIRRELQVLDSITENDFHGAFEVWRKQFTTIYIPMETILKEMAARIG